LTAATTTVAMTAMTVTAVTMAMMVTRTTEPLLDSEGIGRGRRWLMPGRSVLSCNHPDPAACSTAVEEGTLKSPGYCTGTADDDPYQWHARSGCEVRQILDRIADKWSLLVIALLERRTLRFNELRREIEGISQRMLTVTLRQLERDGLVHRTIHTVIPPRVEYRLTPLGATLHHTIQTLVTWTEDHQDEIAVARAEYDRRDAAQAGA
jgi:DNA-binding HxlR family transcriptional regulator